MTINLSEGRYRIDIDRKWYLDDLYNFPHTYEQVYFLIYSLLPHQDEGIQEKIKYAYSRFPWRGGYSAVNFYNKLKSTTPKRQRPSIISIQYSSPGWIELSLIIAVAVTVEKVVKAIASAIREANDTYNDIHKGLSERKLLRIEVQRKEFELEKEYAEYIEDSVKKMADLLWLEDVEQMYMKTGSPLKTLKILLSLYRRVRTLVDYQNEGKIKL